MILGLHGKMGAGKDTAYERLRVLVTDLPVIRVSYADRLKESVSALLGISRSQIEAWKNHADVVVAVGVRGDFTNRVRTFESTEQSFRQFLQRYGTEAHRHVFGDDFWLDAALPLDRDYSNALYVVTDVRFENEADRIRSLGGSIIRIIGPETNTGSHVSEQTLDCDYTVINTARDGAFTQLDRNLSLLLESEFGLLLAGGVGASQ